MIKQLHKQNNEPEPKKLRNPKRLKQSMSASCDVQIIQNIPADQLDQVEETYKFMLEAIQQARRAQNKRQRMSKEAILHNKQHLPIHNRQCIKIAYLWDKGIKSKEIDQRMHQKSGYCLNRVLASHGRALKNDLWREAKRLMVIKFIGSGIGVRETARMIPVALGQCSPALVCKIMKAEKMRQQTPLYFPLMAVD